MTPEELPMTRTYIDKGDAPLFFDVQVDHGLVHDRPLDGRGDELKELALKRAATVIPGGNREAIAELVDLAADPEQSLYRVLWLEAGGRSVACLGFGRVAATDDTYDCFGLVAADAAWAARALEALSKWLGKAKARMLRFEVDEANAAVAAAASGFGFEEEGRLAEFYGNGMHQRILMWRPDR
jgi:hypothetical protein